MDDGHIDGGCGCPTAIAIIAAVVMFWIIVGMVAYSIYYHEWSHT